ncbi:MAG: hemolysin family protein [Egibacteraceae bacterium]
MGGIGSQLALVALLVLLNAVFAGSEIALISLREQQLANLERRRAAGETLARLARDPNRFLSTIQIGITLAGFLASATAAVTLAGPLVEPLSFLGGAARGTAVVVVTALLSYVTLVLGELAPKRIAMQRAEGWALAVARPLQLLAALARPAVWLLSASTDLVVRLAGGDPSVQRDDVSDEELREMLTSRPGFSRQQRHIVEGTFEIADRTVAQIAVPRTRVTVIDADEPAAEAAFGLIDAGFSRAPAVRGGLDGTVGVAHIRDLVGGSGTAAEHAREPLLLPETLDVLEALRQLRAARQQLALVVDEHGGVEAIVTLEDVLEELVGEIYDEFDPDLEQLRRRPDGSIEVPGAFPVHDLPDVGVHLPEGPYTTVAGLVLERLERLATGGETVQVDGWDVTVLEVQSRAITRVRLRPRTA